VGDRDTSDAAISGLWIGNNNLWAGDLRRVHSVPLKPKPV